MAWATCCATAGAMVYGQGLGDPFQQVLNSRHQAQHPQISQSLAAGGTGGPLRDGLGQPLGHIGLHSGQQQIGQPRRAPVGDRAWPQTGTPARSSARTASGTCPGDSRRIKNSRTMATQIRSGNSCSMVNGILLIARSCLCPGAAHPPCSLRRVETGALCGDRPGSARRRASVPAGRPSCWRRRRRL